MRSIGLIILALCFLAGCNADPRSRREISLLRAEILDLEDRLALATAGSECNSEIIYSDGTIISDPIMDSDGSQIILESDVAYSTAPSDRYKSPLKVKHQIFPDEPNASTRGRLSKRLKSVLPGRVNRDTESIRNPRTLRSRTQTPTPELEIVLDDVADLENVEWDAGDQAPITRIVVNREASVGHNVDGRRGDEGLNLFIQPKTDDGSIIVEAGELTVNLTDPAAAPGDQKIGHWHFTAAETELFFARDIEAGEGILLHLPWELNLPTTRKVVAAVSFTTSDGRTIKTSSSLRIDPPAENYSSENPLVAGWTERDTRWEIGTHNQSPARRSDPRTRSNPRAESGRGQIAADTLAEPAHDERATGSRVKAIPASSTRPATQLPRWRPVR